MEHPNNPRLYLFLLAVFLVGVWGLSRMGPKQSNEENRRDEPKQSKVRVSEWKVMGIAHSDSDTLAIRLEDTSDSVRDTILQIGNRDEHWSFYRDISISDRVRLNSSEKPVLTNH